ncbi:MAG: hypothetical protein MHM6MM_000787 [Cercozoa sp. M6MM]
MNGQVVQRALSWGQRPFDKVVFAGGQGCVVLFDQNVASFGGGDEVRQAIFDIARRNQVSSHRFPSQGQKVVVKVAMPVLTAADGRQQTKRACHAMLSHLPGIMPAHDCFRVKVNSLTTVTVMIMPFADSGTLVSAALFGNEKERLAEELIQGINSLRREGMISDDLEAKNVMLSRDSSGIRHLYIIDLDLNSLVGMPPSNQILSHKEDLASILGVDSRGNRVRGGAGMLRTQYGNGGYNMRGYSAGYSGYNYGGYGGYKYSGSSPYGMYAQGYSGTAGGYRVCYR